MKKQNILLILTIALINAPLAFNADVVVTAKTEGYSAFHDAVMQAGIYDHAKKDEGESGSLAPFTVFVPTNEAFESIKSLDAKKQKKYITYHVVPGKKIEKPEEVMKDGVPTVGEKLLFSSDGTIFLDESETKAKITKGPITAKNGVLYIIDKVLLPAGEKLPEVKKAEDKPEAKEPKPEPKTESKEPKTESKPEPKQEKSAEPTVATQPAMAPAQTAPVTASPIQVLMPMSVSQQEPAITEKTAQTLTASVTQLTQSIQLLIHVIQQAQNPIEPSTETKNTSPDGATAPKTPVVVA